MQIFRKEGCVIHVYKTFTRPASAWIDYGQTAYYIKPAEMDMFRFDPERALMTMIHKVNKGKCRCSKCGWEGNRSEFKRGLMADILCVACSEDYTQQIETDIKTGNHCLKCGEPRSICTC